MVEDITEVVRCRRLELVDADDVVRLAAYCEDHNDSVYVELLTPKRNGSIVLYADETGVGGQTWSRGDTAVIAWTGLDGESTVRVGRGRGRFDLFEATTEGR